MNEAIPPTRMVRRSAAGSSQETGNKPYDSHRAAAQMNSQTNQEMEEEFDLKYGAEHVIKLFAPVSLCMLVVVVTISNISFYTKKDVYLIYTPFNETSSDTFTKTWNAVANSLILISVVIVMTMVLICLYKNSFYKVITVWLIFSTVILMFMFAYLFFEEVLRALNVPMDIFTIALFIWNFGVTGVMCVHWRGPMRVQQAYLIFISALMALVFIKYMPEWTTWVVLFVISIWDLVAVLTPRGPLRILVETAQERNEAIFPSLIYSAVAYPTVTVIMTHNEPERRENNSSPSLVGVSASDSETGEYGRRNSAATPPENSSRGSTTNSSSDYAIAEDVPAVRRHRRRAERQAPGPSESSAQPQPPSMVEEKEGVKLGLGDFIFYSVLVGKASSYGDWNTTLACFVAILIGLCLTLLLLAAFRKALPALPISITFGLVFYFCTRIFVKQFADMLAANQIFI